MSSCWITQAVPVPMALHLDKFLCIPLLHVPLWDYCIWKWTVLSLMFHYLYCVYWVTIQCLLACLVSQCCLWILWLLHCERPKTIRCLVLTSVLQVKIYMAAHSCCSALIGLLTKQPSLEPCYDYIVPSTHVIPPMPISQSPSLVLLHHDKQLHPRKLNWAHV